MNVVAWGDGGYDVHLLSQPVPAYSLIWYWIAMLTIMYGATYAVDGKAKHWVCHLVAGWWVANIGMTTILNEIAYRGVEASTWFAGSSSLVLDFAGQSAVDLAALVVIWYFAARKGMGVSLWTLVFCAFLVGNLFGHTIGAYSLMSGIDPDLTAMRYDSYMYTIFTLMLTAQAGGAWGDAILRWWGSNVNLYADLLPALRRSYNRYFPLF